MARTAEAAELLDVDVDPYARLVARVARDRHGRFEIADAAQAIPEPPGFKPWPRDVQWYAAHEPPIRPMRDRLAFTGDGASWGYRFRFGLFEITGEDAALIATATMVDFTGSAGPQGGAL